MELHNVLNSIGTVLALVGLIWFGAVKFTRLEVKVETLWQFLIKRAVVEGVNANLMTTNSPVRLEEHSREMFLHLADELKAFGDKNKNLSESELMLAIEREYGSRLVHEVCIPNRISFGSCLLIATAVAKGGHTLTEVLDEYHIPKNNERIG